MDKSQSYQLTTPAGRAYRAAFDPGEAEVWFSRPGHCDVALWLTSAGTWVVDRGPAHGGFWKITAEDAAAWLSARHYDPVDLQHSDRVRIGVPLASKVKEVASRLNVDNNTLVRIAIDAFLSNHGHQVKYRRGIARDAASLLETDWTPFYFRKETGEHHRILAARRRGAKQLLTVSLELENGESLYVCPNTQILAVAIVRIP